MTSDLIQLIISAGTVVTLILGFLCGTRVHSTDEELPPCLFLGGFLLIGVGTFVLCTGGPTVAALAPFVGCFLMGIAISLTTRKKTDNDTDDE